MDELTRKLQLLNDPAALEAVRKLSARELSELVLATGLEDSGDLLRLATQEQLEAVLDEDLWRAPGPGATETFDDDRFARWIEVLVELGAEEAVKRVAGLDEEMVGLGLSRLVQVFDLHQVALAGWQAFLPSDVDELLASAPSIEIERWLVSSRGQEGWSELVELLLQLAEDEGELFERLMMRCEEATSSGMIERERSSHGALSVADEVADDVADARESRRTRAGYVGPADAVAFLRLAERQEVGDDAITRAHLGRLLLRAPEPGGTALADRQLRRALAVLDEELGAARQRELAYLANILVAAGEEGRALRPIEAAELALHICQLGWAKGGGDLYTTSLVRWFGRGWRLRRRGAAR